MKKPLCYGAIVLLVVLHQDFWWWGDRTVVFGFLPIGLAWHILISLAAGGLWALATVVAWPRELDIPEDASPQDSNLRP